MEIATSIKSFRAARQERKIAKEKERQEKVIAETAGSLALKLYETDAPISYPIGKTGTAQETQELVRHMSSRILQKLDEIDPAHPPVECNPLLTEAACLEGDVTNGSWKGALKPFASIVFVRTN